MDSADSPEVRICLADDNAYCANVEGNDNRSGQPVWLWSSKGGDETWFEVSGFCVDSDACVEFEDVQQQSLCLAASDTQGVQLLSCNNEGTSGLLGCQLCSWNLAGDDVDNDFWFTEGWLGVVPGTLHDGQGMVVASSGISGVWYRWVGP